jgi:hypothetical protein
VAALKRAPDGKAEALFYDSMVKGASLHAGLHKALEDARGSKPDAVFPRPADEPGTSPAIPPFPALPGNAAPAVKLEAGKEVPANPLATASGEGDEEDEIDDLPPSPIWGAISIVTAVLSIVTCVGGILFAPIAIICGHTALAKARHSPVQPAPGHTLGAIGLMIGYVSLILLIITLFLTLIFEETLLRDGLEGRRFLVLTEGDVLTETFELLPLTDQLRCGGLGVLRFDHFHVAFRRPGDRDRPVANQTEATQPQTGRGQRDQGDKARPLCQWRSGRLDTCLRWGRCGRCRRFEPTQFAELRDRDGLRARRAGDFATGATDRHIDRGVAVGTTDCGHRGLRASRARGVLVSGRPGEMWLGQVGCFGAGVSGMPLPAAAIVSNTAI